MKKKNKKIRLDRLLIDRELASSLKEAAALIMSGDVLVEEVPVDKSGALIDEGAKIRLRVNKGAFVSRGGTKLEHAMNEFSLDVEGLICMDVGASTGGFTDCLLRRGAKKVYCVDVGYGQLDLKIARDARVEVLDRQNIRDLKREQIPEPVDIAVVDVSFISLKLVFPALQPFIKKGGRVLALIKPQFEADRKEVKAGGLVDDPAVHKRIMGQIISVAEGLGWKYVNFVPSPIQGASGNTEFLMLFKV